MPGSHPIITFQGQFEEQVDGAPLSNPRAFSVTPVGTSYGHQTMGHATVLCTRV